MANDGSSPAEQFTLIEAVTRWLDPVLVARVQDAERHLTPYEHDKIRWAKLTSRSEWRQPTSRDWVMGGPDYTTLQAAWADLLVNLRRRIETEELFVAGVPEDDPDGEVRRPINNLFAASMKFDVGENVIDCRGKKYFAVRVSRAPMDEAMPSDAALRLPHGSTLAAHPRRGGGQPVNDAARNLHHLQLADFAELSDEMVLALLEEHADRVVKSGEAKLIHPTKISVMPIIRRKMEHRAKMGELLPSLAGEMAFLAGWIAEKVTSHQTPVAGSIENALRKEYWALRAQSNGMKA